MANFAAILFPGIILMIVIATEETSGAPTGSQLMFPGYVDKAPEAPVTSLQGRDCLPEDPSMLMRIVNNFLTRDYGQASLNAWNLLFADDNVVMTHSGTRGKEAVKNELKKLFSSGVKVTQDVLSMHTESSALWALVHTVSQFPSKPNTEVVEGNVWYMEFNCLRQITTMSIHPTGYRVERPVKS